VVSNETPLSKIDPTENEPPTYETEINLIKYQIRLKENGDKKLQ